MDVKSLEAQLTNVNNKCDILATEVDTILSWISQKFGIELISKRQPLNLPPTSPLANKDKKSIQTKVTNSPSPTIHGVPKKFQVFGKNKGIKSLLIVAGASATPSSRKPTVVVQSLEPLSSSAKETGIADSQANEENNDGFEEEFHLKTESPTCINIPSTANRRSRQRSSYIISDKLNSDPYNSSEDQTLAENLTTSTVPPSKQADFEKGTKAHDVVSCSVKLHRISVPFQADKEQSRLNVGSQSSTNDNSNVHTESFYDEVIENAPNEGYHQEQLHDDKPHSSTSKPVTVPAAHKAIILQSKQRSSLLQQKRSPSPSFSISKQIPSGTISNLSTDDSSQESSNDSKPRIGRPKKHPEERVKTYDSRLPSQCEECGKILKGSGALRVHKQIHLNIRPFPCTVCGQAFRRKHILDFHMMIHEGNKKEVCRFCGKAFLVQRDLARHERTHTGERPYGCHLCPKRFNVKQHLTLHIRTHTGERPYRCQICNKAFTQANSLRIHKKIHLKDGKSLETSSESIRVPVITSVSTCNPNSSNVSPDEEKLEAKSDSKPMMILGL